MKKLQSLTLTDILELETTSSKMKILVGRMNDTHIQSVDK